MSNLSFILIAIIVPLLSVLSFILSLLAHIQTERTRKHTTRALRRLRLDINSISKTRTKPLILAEEQHTEPPEQLRSSSPSPSLSQSSPSTLHPHMLSYAQESSILAHLTSLLQSRLPYLSEQRRSAVVTDFGNLLQEWRRGEEGSVGSVEGMEKYLQFKLSKALLSAEMNLTSGQSAGILDEFGLRVREIWREGRGQRSGSDGRQALEGEDKSEESIEIEQVDLMQSWSWEYTCRTRSRG